MGLGTIALELLTGSWNLIKMGFSAVGTFLSKLDAQGVAGLCVALVLAFLWLRAEGESRHWHKQSNRFESLYNAELTHEAKIAKQATDLKTRIDGLSASITNTLKDQHDAEASRIDADADAVRVRGPGKAVCSSHPVAPAAAVRHDETASTANAAGPPLSSGDWAAVPWEWLVTRAQQFDQLLNDVATTKEQHRQLEQQWPKSDAIQSKPAVPYPNGARN